MNINTPIFETALVDDVYAKPAFNQIMAEIIAPETLVESDETLLNFMVQTFNDAGNKQVTLLDVVKKLQATPNNPSNQALLSKIRSSPQVSASLDRYFVAKQKENRRWIIGFILFAILASIIALKAMGFIHTPTFGGSKVVMIDPLKLASTANAAMIERDLSSEQVQVFAEDYRKNLMDIITNYAKDGYVILNRSSVYAMDERQDITDEVVKKLGFKPVDPSQFESQYSSAQRYDVLRSFAQINLNHTQEQLLNEVTAEANQRAEKTLESTNLYSNADGQSIDLE